MNNTGHILESLRRSWTRLAQFAVWATAVIATFLMSPPRKSAALEEAIWVRFTQFVLIIVLGLIIALLSRRRYIRSLYAALSSAFLVLALAGFFTNMVVVDKWTCTFDERGPMVIGITLTAHAKAHIQKYPDVSCSMLIQDFAGELPEIWAGSEVTSRHAILVGLYLFNVLSFSLSMVFMLEALRPQPGECSK